MMQAHHIVLTGLSNTSCLMCNNARECSVNPAIVGYVMIVCAFTHLPSCSVLLGVNEHHAKCKVWQRVITRTSWVHVRYLHGVYVNHNTSTQSSSIPHMKGWDTGSSIFNMSALYLWLFISQHIATNSTVSDVQHIVCLRMPVVPRAILHHTAQNWPIHTRELPNNVILESWGYGL